MTKKNTINLTLTYKTWAVCIPADQSTKSISKMKKILAADIKNVLVNGYKKYGEREAALKLSVPFFPPAVVLDDMKVKVEFDEKCKFKCEELLKLSKTKNEQFEVSGNGPMTVTIGWMM